VLTIAKDHAVHLRIAVEQRKTDGRKQVTKERQSFVR
jgi:hypothetical protein